MKDQFQVAEVAFWKLVLNRLMKTKIYNQKGESVSEITLPEEIFACAWNEELVYQVAISQEANRRSKTAHTKDRSEVSGTGKKPWRQKGTGRARHGSKRSPIWVGGGIAHGPRSEKDYSKKINRKMSRKALAVVLSKKLSQNEIIFVDDFKMKDIKTKDAVDTIINLSKISGFGELKTKKKNVALVALSEKNGIVEKSFRNIGKVVLDEVRNLNVLDILNKKFLVIVGAEKAVEDLKTRLVK